jgi:hypothetical protein
MGSPWQVDHGAEGLSRRGPGLSTLVMTDKLPAD